MAKSAQCEWPDYEMGLQRGQREEGKVKGGPPEEAVVTLRQA